jgi:NodT family efflux transporter outer membrane factor (OMF) lipoprotein
VDAQLEIFKLTETRFKGGAATERDVEQARALLLGTEATIPTLEAQLRQAKDALCVLMGIPPDDLADILQGASDIPAPPPTVAIGIPADLLRRRPDVRSAELQAIAQSAQIGIAKADFLPAFSLTGSFGFLSADAGGASLVDLFSYKSRTGSFGPAIQWKILDYGRTANNVRVQDALLQELLISYKNTVLKAQQEVEDALAGFLRSGENAELLSQSAAAAKKSLDLAVVQYERGSIDFTTVLLSQQLLLTAQDGLALSLGNIAGNLIGVYRALGGGWEIREGQDLVAPETREAMEKRTNWGKLLSPTVYMPPDAGAQPTIRRPDW